MWTAHNLRGHEENPVLRKVYNRLFPRRVRYVHCLTRHSERAVLEDGQYSSARVFVRPHGHYLSMYPRPLPREEARERLGLPQGARVLLFFGQIRPYKNLEALVTVFRELAETDPDLFLLIAGQPRYDLDPSMLEHPRIRAHLGLVEDADVPVYFGAASWVVCPYQAVTNSGTALLALSFCRPFIGPDLAALRELREEIGGGWLRTYDGDLTAGKLGALVRDPPPGERLDLSAFEWSHIARQFTSVLERPESVVPRAVRR